FNAAKKTLAPLLQQDVEPSIKASAQSIMDWLKSVEGNHSAISGPIPEEKMGAGHNRMAHRSDSAANPERLMLAATEGNSEGVKTILSSGVDVNTTDSSGRTELSYAADNGRVEVIRLLKSMSADLNTKDENGKTALIYAATSGRIEALKLLLEMGADVNACDA